MNALCRLRFSRGGLDSHRLAKTVSDFYRQSIRIWTTTIWLVGDNGRQNECASILKHKRDAVIGISVGLVPLPLSEHFAKPIERKFTAANRDDSKRLPDPLYLARVRINEGF